MEAELINIDPNIPLWEQVREDQWCKDGNYYNFTSRGGICKACLLGYLRIMFPTPPDTTNFGYISHIGVQLSPVGGVAVRRIKEVLTKKRPDLDPTKLTFLSGWSDDPKTTFEEFKSVLKEAGV